jgi:uncharacterized protein
MKNFILFFLFFSSLSFGASFDCNKASTKHEKLICSDEELNKADEEMGKVYKQAYSVDKEFISQTQKNFLKYYKKCNSKDSCLELVYSRYNSLLAHYQLLNDINNNKVDEQFEGKIPLLKATCDATKKLITAITNNDKKTFLQFVDLNYEMDNGPRINDLKKYALNEIFNEKWFERVSNDLCGYFNPYKGGMIGNGMIWFYPTKDEKSIGIFAMNDFKQFSSTEPLEPIWKYKNTNLFPQCFTHVWSSGDNYEALYDHHFNNGEYQTGHYEKKDFLDLIENPGKHLGKTIPSLDPFKSPWEDNEKVAISVPVDICINDELFDGGYIKTSSKLKKSYSVNKSEYVYEEHDTEYDSKTYSKYTKLFNLDTKVCNDLANSNIGQCNEGYILEVTSYNDLGRHIDNNFFAYGIFTVSNKDYIVPLKRFSNKNEVLNFIDNL